MPELYPRMPHFGLDGADPYQEGFSRLLLSDQGRLWFAVGRPRVVQPFTA